VRVNRSGRIVNHVIGLVNATQLTGEINSMLDASAR
jgi:hypothetical protein